MKKVIFSLAISTVLMLAITSCKQEGIGGDATIAFHVKHHSSDIPGAIVYIKYGEKTSPGTDAGNYDDSMVADAEGHGHFENLFKGDYYLFAVGYDSAITSVVNGGTPVKISSKTGEIEVDVPVVE